MEITEEKYQSILSMMRSADEENKVVALTIIDQLVWKDNVTKILLLKKHSSSKIELWKEHAPEIYGILKKLTEKGILDVNRHLTYKQVMKAILAYDVKPEELDFYFRDFASYMTEQVRAAGCKKLVSLELLTKYTTDEQTE